MQGIPLMAGIDKNGMEIGFGDRVHYFIPGHGSSAGIAFVAGEMSYSEHGSHVLLVNENEIGMPIHAGHCQVFSRGHAETVAPLRDRYIKMYPKALKSCLPIPDQ